MTRYHIIVPYTGTVLVHVDAETAEEALSLLTLDHPELTPDETEFDLADAEVDHEEEISE